jgi:hypothetical protein
VAKKKNNRPKVSAETLERARAELRGEKLAAAEPQSSSRTATGTRAKVVARSGVNLATRRMPTAEELRVQYAYVLQDLRKLVIVAGLLLVAVVVFALILPPVQF